ncbi:DUF4339 domain-containing protein [Pseudomonas sp. CM27]|uniref:DUF4339 domain-containing protein n=1 Tax=Pseudomonas sp. CM27 TaxID=2738452 RepID=UPI001556326D|nr:DUF4339 domain-containing protein [Pseudomonas sp. CM27]NQD72933.1 DUF4339 domain-containing protein [Pseudomonas sp. CM27]
MSHAYWYYALNGSRQGPFTLEQMHGFASTSAIQPETKVWQGAGDWVELKETVLASSIPKPVGPPPLAATDIDNRFVWALVGVQLVGGVIELISGAAIWWAFVILNIGLCIADERRLKAAGHSAPATWWALIVPGYLWKRAVLLGHKKNYFFAWIAAFVVSIALAAAGGDSAIEDAACPLVTDIIHKQLFQRSSCIAVTIDDEPSSGFYRATALLDNGNEIDITIQKKGDNIFVQVPRQ